ncbi:MAG: chromosome segregation protein SMC [Christensenella sp.]|nr:chromosome segregation protein SMC [Christensenella sp.]
MFLKRIEVNGFKSFCNKKEIIINKGITGVVGPNGSGKSNIADALRWVLGEQSSKSLRGSSMQDVIFNGTQNRSKKNYCEVSLVFDNSDMRIKSEYTEISVRRKMYRSGESEYYINNAGCRLKDILELFRDTGIGKEGYSIIGQGKIDEILTSKSTQRRKVFEEAAGIMKYRVRKEEAEKNLQKTNDNIMRLDDIISELQSQLEPLEKQMNEAKDYLSLRDRLKELEVNLYLYQCDKTDERTAKITQQILENEQETQEVSGRIADGVRQISEWKKELSCIQEEIESQNAALSGQMSLQERVNGALNVLNEKEAGNVKEQQANAEKRDALAEEVDRRTKKIEQIDGDIRNLNTIIDEKYDEIVKLRLSVEKISGSSGDSQEKIDSLKQEVESARLALQTLTIDASEWHVKAEVLEKKYQESQEETKKHQQYLDELKKQVEVFTEEKNTSEDAAAGLRVRHSESTQALLKLRQQEQEKSQEAAKLVKQLNEDESRWKLLSEMRAEYEGYFDSVRSLFRQAKNDPEIFSRMKGILAEVIEVPKEYETPLEVILGNALQNVVVENEEDAKAIIAYLRKNNLGRVTFLPAKALKVRGLQPNEKNALSMDGVMCVASEAITCSAEVRPAVDFLLGRTVIVQDMDSAIALMRKTDYALRAVTMDGDFVKPGGVITGGSLKNTKTGLLSRKRMAQELEDSVAQTKERIEQHRKEIDALTHDVQSEQEKQKTALEALRALEIRQAEIKQKLASANEMLEARDRVSAELAESAQETLREWNEAEVRLNEIKKDREAAQEAFDSVNSRLAQTEEQAAQNAQETAGVKDRLAACELEQTELNNQKNILLNEAEHLRMGVLRAQQETQSLLEQNKAITEEVKNITHEKAELRFQLDEILNQIKQAGQASQESVNARTALGEKIAGCEQQNEEWKQKKDGLIEEKYRLIANKEKTELSKETYQNKLWDDYGLTYANAAAFRMEFSYQQSTRELETIRQRIRGMGTVNPNAIEDYARVKERYDSLVLQREDLISAGRDLQVVISDLLTGMKGSFRERFGQINDNFKVVFQELFGGGFAELVLQDEEDLMECGIDIIAEPPGKKLQNIQLLSGGEKALTAIALLFAMLNINPSPICLLDEIDAPLDDANVIRFSEYLKKLSGDLQFIVITHRKPSMAICDTLYGVAMQEKGVSDIVSVQF